MVDTTKIDPLAAQLQATLDKIPAYTWYANPTGGLTFVNTRSADYIGLPSDHPLRLGIDTGAGGDSHMALLHPEDAAETRRVWSNCLKTGAAGEVSFRVRNADGAYRWFLSRAEPLRAQGGTILYWIGINLDIEDRKRAEIELQQMLDLAPQLIVVLGPQQERLYANRPALTYLSGTLEEWRQRAPGSETHPDDVERGRAIGAQAIISGSPYEGEVRLRAVDRGHRWVLARHNPGGDPPGTIMHRY